MARVSSLQWMSAAAATRIRPSLTRAFCRLRAKVPDTVHFDAIKESLKKVAAALQRAEVPFLLGGGLAVWVRGGPETEHDLDLFVRPEDAERAREVLADEGMRTEKPPENWLYKAWNGEVLIDLIFSPSGEKITDEHFRRGEHLEVNAVRMQVASLEDVLVTKLLALAEHEADFEPVLEIARAVREQVDWAQVRARTAESPFAKAFFTLVEELGILGVPAPSIE
jgi:predicted nucleotidyltransferase